MISFNFPMKFRGKHAAYAHYLSTDKGQKRRGGVNVFSKIVDAYMISILVGLKYNRTSQVDSNTIYYRDIFDNPKEWGDKSVNSSDINPETMIAYQNKLNYIYRVVMLTEKIRGLNNEEKISNAFKSENDAQRMKDNLELMNSFSRGGLEILYEKFQGQSNDENEILRLQLELFDELSDYTSEIL